MTYAAISCFLVPNIKGNPKLMVDLPHKDEQAPVANKTRQIQNVTASQQ
jgi:hypothetical protein